MSFLPPDAAQIFKSNSGARLTIYGGFLLDDTQIKRFFAAQRPAPEVRQGNSPANDIHQWLVGRGLPVFLEPCRVQPPECEDNPALALIFFTQKNVPYADIDLTDSGVVPLKPHEPTQSEKERVRRWLQLEPAEADAYDAHVTDLAQRVFYFDVEPSDNEITAIFEHIAKIVGKAPRDVQFSIVYNWDQMVDIKGHEDFLNKMYQQIMESQLAEDAANVSGQSRDMLHVMILPS